MTDIKTVGIKDLESNSTAPVGMLDRVRLAGAPAFSRVFPDLAIAP